MQLESEPRYDGDSSIGRFVDSDIKNGTDQSNRHGHVTALECT